MARPRFNKQATKQRVARKKKKAAASDKSGERAAADRLVKQHKADRKRFKRQTGISAPARNKEALLAEQREYLKHMELKSRGPGKRKAPKRPQFNRPELWDTLSRKEKVAFLKNLRKR